MGRACIGHWCAAAALRRQRQAPAQERERERERERPRPRGPAAHVLRLDHHARGDVGGGQRAQRRLHLVHLAAAQAGAAQRGAPLLAGQRRELGQGAHPAAAQRPDHVGVEVRELQQRGAAVGRLGCGGGDARGRGGGGGDIGEGREGEGRGGEGRGGTGGGVGKRVSAARRRGASARGRRRSPSTGCRFFSSTDTACTRHCIISTAATEGASHE
jgi:hypothetical protein